MPSARVNGSRIKTMVYDHLNAAVGVARGTYSDNPRYPREMILDEIVASDYEFSVAIARVPGHSERGAFVQSVTTLTQPLLTSPNRLRVPDTIGEVDPPMILRTDGQVVEGKTAPPNLIDIWRADTAGKYGGPTIKEGYYSTLNGTFKFTGVSAYLTTYDVVHGSWSGANGVEVFTLKAPEQCEFAVAAHVLGKLLMKQEDFPGASQFYMAQAVSGLQAIAEGGTPIQKIEMYQQQR